MIEWISCGPLSHWYSLLMVWRIKISFVPMISVDEAIIKQESTPTWTQVAYRPWCSKYSLCCSVSLGEGEGREGCTSIQGRCPPSKVGTPYPGYPLSKVGTSFFKVGTPRVDRHTDRQTRVKTLPSLVLPMAWHGMVIPEWQISSFDVHLPSSQSYVNQPTGCVVSCGLEIGHEH